MGRDPLRMKSGFPLSQIQGFDEGFDEHLIRGVLQTAAAFAGIPEAMLAGVTVDYPHILPVH